MTNYKLQQIVAIEPTGIDSIMPLEERLRHWERALVGQLARQVHQAGEEFSRWPEIERDEATVGGSVVVTVTCTGLPRPPWHAWRSNEDPDVDPRYGNDYCLTCKVWRWENVAAQPCPGPKS